MSSINIAILSFFVFVFFVFFRFANPRLLNFHRRKNEAKTGKKKHKPNKTEQNLSNAFVALKETHVFEESGTTKASVSDRFPLEKVHHLSPPGVHTCHQTRQCLFFGGEVGFRLFFFFFDLTYIIMFRHIQRNFLWGFFL